MSAYQLLSPEQLRHVLSRTSPHSFSFNIRRMNAMYKLPIVTEPSLDKLTKPNGDPETAISRQVGFLKTLRGECAEGDEILVKMELYSAWRTSSADRETVAERVAALVSKHNLSLPISSLGKLIDFGVLVAIDVNEALKDLLVDQADWLSDIMVYCRSEGMKYGLPIEEVLEAVMGSNFTKLPADGIPIHDANGKFLKDMTNYVAPEPAIKAILFGLKPSEGVRPCGAHLPFDGQEDAQLLAAAQDTIGKTESGAVLRGAPGTSASDLQG